MSTQPIDGSQYVVIGTVGTTVISDQKVTLKSIIIPGTYVGTVKFHDTTTAAGTTATSAVFVMGLPATVTPFDVQLGLNFKKGLVIESTGTPTLTFGFDK